MTNEIKTRTANFLFQDGIVYCMYLPNIEVTWDAVKRNSDAHWKIAQEEMHPALVKMNSPMSNGWIVQEYHLDEGSKFATATAFLVNLHLKKVYGNLILKIKKRHELNKNYPIRHFSFENEAISWLQPFVR